MQTMSADEEVTAGDCRVLKAKLKRALEQDNATDIHDVLSDLEVAEMTRKILVDTKIAQVLNDKDLKKKALDKDIIARVRRLRHKWKLLFNPTAIPQELSPTQLGSNGSPYTTATMMNPTNLSRRFPERTTPPSPPPTNEHTPYDLSRRWNGVDGCVGEDNRWHRWSRSIIRSPGERIEQVDFAGPYAVPF
eukprot:m.67552 g.67552  ORF g.67552 m.67552 type:complete len:191 (-) comp23832_c0_seq1:114-686(-)